MAKDAWNAYGQRADCLAGRGDRAERRSRWSEAHALYCEAARWNERAAKALPSGCERLIRVCVANAEILRIKAKACAGKLLTPPR